MGHDKNHASEHVDGTDDIQDASNSQKGLATAAQVTMQEGHKDRHDPNDGADPLECATPGSIDENANAEGVAHSLARSDHNHQHLASLHENGGGAEIGVAGLSGLLADDQHIIDAEAVSAMGVKGDANPLNHDRPIQATESVVGIAEIATQVETDAGTDDTKIVTPQKLAAYPISATPTVIKEEEAATDSTTTTASWVEAAKFTKTLDTAKYIVFYSMEIEIISGGANDYCLAQFKIGATERGYASSVHGKYDMKSEPVYLDATAGNYDFIFNFKRDGTAGTCYIRRKRLVIMKVTI